MTVAVSVPGSFPWVKSSALSFLCLFCSCIQGLVLRWMHDPGDDLRPDSGHRGVSMFQSGPSSV